jgi:hypothetical protein
MSDNQQKRKINMSKQTCNYCKVLGHRIHTMDAFGVYLVGSDGERVLNCPVLIDKEKINAKRAMKTEEEFPALPGQKGGVASAATLALPGAIAAAEKDRKQREWLAAKELKEQKKRAWTERHVKRMVQKYGDIWYNAVAGTTEDCDVARGIRSYEEYNEMVEEDRTYHEDRERDAEHRAKWEKEEKEREERRSTMTEEEKWREEEEYEDALETAYERENDSIEYWKMTGIWSR